MISTANIDSFLNNCKRSAGTLLNAQTASCALKGCGQIVVIKHKIAQTLSNAYKAAYAAFLVQKHHTIPGSAQRYSRAHVYAYSALVTNRNDIAALIVRAYSNCALSFILGLVPSLRAHRFTTPATCTPGGFRRQFFQIECPSLSRTDTNLPDNRIIY